MDKLTLKNFFMFGLPYLLTLDEVGGNNELVVPPNAQDSRNATLDAMGDFVAVYAKMTATNRNLLVSISETQTRRSLVNRPIHAETIFGTGQLPFRYPHPLYLAGNEALQYHFQDLSGAANTVQVVNDGYRLFPGKKQEFLKLFPQLADRRLLNGFYTTDAPVALAIGGNAVAYITMRNINFWWYTMTHKSDGPFSLRITDSRSGQSFSSSLIHSENMGGTAQNYAEMEPPMPIMKNSILKVELFNRHPAINNIYLTLIGVHLYDE